MNIQHYLNERVEGQINYYERKGSLNKTYYLRFKISQMVAAALLPFASIFITEFGPAKYLVALLGTMVTILEGILAIGKYHEKWINYRATAEALQQEKFIYLMHAGPYVGREAATTFVNRIEMMLGKENQGWQKMALAEPPKEEKNQDQPNEAGDNGETNGEDNTNAAAAAANGTTLPGDLNGQSTDDVLNDPATGVSNDSEEQTEELETASSITEEDIDKPEENEEEEIADPTLNNK